MPKEKKHTVGKLIITLLTVVPSLFRTVQDVIVAIQAQVKLIGKKITLLLFLCLMIAILVSAIWLNLLALLFAYLILSMKLSIISSLFILLSCNFVFIILVVAILQKTKSGLFKLKK